MPRTNPFLKMDLWTSGPQEGATASLNHNPQHPLSLSPIKACFRGRPQGQSEPRGRFSEIVDDFCRCSFRAQESKACGKRKCYQLTDALAQATTDQGDKPKGTNLRGFSQIFADSCRFSPFPIETKRLIFAENR